MVSESINILCTPDDNYVPYCGIMLTSLLENNKKAHFDIYIASNNINSNNKNNLKRLSQLYNCTISFIFVNREIFNTCPIREGDHVSIAAYYRIIAPKILPKDIHKILYLDCDIIINGDITGLYNTSIAEFSFGAIIDEGYYNPQIYRRLEYSKEFHYINSGVVLFNLDYWRKNNLSEECLSYISKNYEKVIFHDQDTLNAVLHGTIKFLPITYNFQTGYMLTHYSFGEEIKKEIEKEVYTPKIIHYTGYGKPWHIHSQHPYAKRFIHYRDLSIWKDTPIIDNSSIKDKIRYLITSAIWWLGLKKRPLSYIIDKQP